MKDLFIESIRIEKVRNLEGFVINIDRSKRKHLIITGRNGTGKSSILNAVMQNLHNFQNGNYRGYDSVVQTIKHNRETLKQPNLHGDQRRQLLADLSSQENWLSSFGGLSVDFNGGYSAVDEQYTNGKFVLAFFSAKRDTTLKTPTGINKLNLKSVYQLQEHAGVEFIQYIVNLKADRSFAKDENDHATVNEIDKWFVGFEQNLRRLISTNTSEDIQLKFNRRAYNFDIIEEGKAPYTLNQLSDGFSACLSILTELIMRMEHQSSKIYDIQGVVLIDEIETHLHIDLQKKILPFLIAFFPQVQFIVTTHSPFVLNSIQDSVICDLEKKIVTSDLSGYSYDTLIESYFDSNNYSEILLAKIADFERLASMGQLTAEDSVLFRDLTKYFNDVPKFISDELAVKLQQIKLKNMKPKQ